MKKIAFILFVILNLGRLTSQTKYELNCDRELLKEAIEIANQQIGTKECDCRNRGEVERYLKLFDAAPGTPYCAAGLYYCFYNACQHLKLDLKSIPIPKSMLANAIFDYAKLNGHKTSYIPGIGDLIIWRKRQSIFGHIEMIKSIAKAGWINTIGFNTEKRINNLLFCGVFEHKRNIYHPLGRLAVRGLVGFRLSR